MNETARKGPVAVAIIGAGHRSVGYASYALKHPDRMKVVAVADPNAVRRDAVGRDHDIPTAMRFESFQQMAARPKLADAIINGTMDRLHHASTMPFLALGYDILLEKPISPFEQEVRDLIATSKKHNRLIMICHVLRYAPFYTKVKELLADHRIGQVIGIHTTENVSYHHMATAFVRGRWNNRDTSAPMLLAKCCHDLDLLAWFMSGIPAVRVASFGALSQFKAENAPEGSALRCLDGCKIESTCPYSARSMYITKGLWAPYAWESIEKIKNPTVDQKLESLKTDNPYGRCVWHCDNNVVDHQTVAVQFANGVTASHDMLCATSRPCRKVHLIGSLGEIEGDMEAGTIFLRHPSPDRNPNPARAEEVYTEQRIDIQESDDGHGGGDSRLIEDFVTTVTGSKAAGLTKIEDSLTGHLIAFAADKAMTENRVVEIH